MMPGQQVDADHADRQAADDDEDQVFGRNHRGDGGEERAKENVGNGAAPGDQTEQPLGLAGVEDFAGKGPELEDSQAADDVEENKQGAERAERLSVGSLQKQAKEEGADQKEGIEDEDQPVGAEPAGCPGVDGGHDHQHYRGQDELEGDGRFGEVAEKEGAAGQLPGDDDAAHDRNRIEQHQQHPLPLSLLDAE